MKRRIEWLLIAVAAATGGYLLHAVLPGGKDAEAAASAMATPVDPPGQISFPVGAPQLSAVRVEPVGLAPLPISEPLNARLAYDEEVTARIGTPVAGRVTQLRAAVGDAVKAGDPLMGIDAPDLAAAVADQRKAVADEQRKKLSYERSEKLFQAEVIPRKDLESAKADFDQAQAETQRAQLRLRNLAPGRDGGSGLWIRSPVSGAVVERKAGPGLEVVPGMADPLVVVSNLGRLWLLIDLPERHLAQVHPGQVVSFAVDAYPGKAFIAKVARIGQVVNPDTRRIQVRCDVINGGDLRPEMYARAILLAEQGRQALRIPNAALVTEGLYSYLFVDIGAGRFEKRRMSLLVQDREFAYAEAGLKEGERIVTGGALLLQSEINAGR